MVALQLAWEHEGRGEQAQTAGWTARAVAVLADQPESLGHGWLAWFQAREELYAGRPEEALSLLERSARSPAASATVTWKRWLGGIADARWLALGGWARASR